MSADNSSHIEKRWTVDLSIDEHQGITRARARLRWGEKDKVGVGTARLSPADQNIAEIGDELAIARALSDLAGQMLRVSAHDIEAATDEPATLLY
ncbi:hypothetical protein B7435_32910 [Mycolicibacterium peregrinum]|uniref:DUF1876 domain-containing protein n=1 Tax=Mycolicibacterium peregrinum TaxID=43304 RepID=UPI000B4B89F7|nr:DUF1876 domain-containing protein [Mycolicibacterium peregrinum]OWL93640.1 hypothetical protein B7435_32910 [Mycolicibacterium peregrinum]